MSTPGGPYGEYGGPLPHYGVSPTDPRAPITPGSPYGQRYGLPVPPPAYRPVSAPHPSPAHPPVPYPPALLQRPAGVGTASTLAITASLLFVCGLGLLWLVAYSITSSFDAAQDDQAVIFHIAERFQLRLTQGLAIPLFGFPVLGTVAGFLVLVQRSWARWVFTAVGVLSLAWSAWWLRSSLPWWVPALVYVGTAVGIVWTAAASRWYAAGDAAAASRLNRP